MDVQNTIVISTSGYENCNFSLGETTTEIAVIIFMILHHTGIVIHGCLMNELLLNQSFLKVISKLCTSTNYPNLVSPVEARINIIVDYSTCNSTKNQLPYLPASSGGNYNFHIKW